MRVYAATVLMRLSLLYWCKFKASSYTVTYKNAYWKFKQLTPSRHFSQYTFRSRNIDMKASRETPVVINKSETFSEVAFDPLGFSSPEKLGYMRECELKHGRLAMIALGGWPFAEVIFTYLERAIPPSSVCSGSGCNVDADLAASALSLETIGSFAFIYWSSALLLAVIGEIVLGIRKSKFRDDISAGDLGLDPFKWANDDMRLKELKHGRLAMGAFAFHYISVLAQNKGIVIAHQVWGEVCVYNLRVDLGFPTPICYPRLEAALDTVLSWEIMFRVLTGYFKEPYY